MDLKNALVLLRGGLDLAEKAIPVAVSFGVPNANVAGVFLEIGKNILERLDDGAAALASDDVAELKAILGKLQILNDALAAEIAAS